MMTSKSTPTLGALDHVALAVPNIVEASLLFQCRFSVTISEITDLPEHGVRVAWIGLGNCQIELIEPLGPESPLHKFLAKHPGGGLHHICCNVAGLGDTITSLQDQGLSPSPIRKGAHGHDVSFMHPKDLNGMLLELQQTPDKS